MNVNLTPIFEAVIALLASLITCKLIPWIKEHVSETRQRRLAAAAKSLVFAAEQLYGAGKGEEKFRYVQQKLAEKGFEIDVDEIEAAVAQYLNYVPELTLMEAQNDDKD